MTCGYDQFGTYIASSASAREVAAIPLPSQLCSQRPQGQWTPHSCLKVSSGQDFIRHGFGSSCNSGETVRGQSEACNEDQGDSCQGHVKSRRPRSKV